ncbi:ABC transporter permease [Streptomyces sp. NPDC020801]|uniref:ABC transporter permease n=1 Tax=unclassified Streptomyces TaxID=2593676 RepID=UPI0037A73921
MTIAAPLIPTTSAQRLRWVFADAWVLARRNMIHWFRTPVVMLYSLLWPVVMVLLFGYVFGSAMKVPGGGDYREFLMPGLYGQTMVFGVATTLTAITTDVAKGATDRFRSMPMSGSAVVLGRSLADMFYSVLELASLVICGLAVGWRWHHGPAKALAAIGLYLLLRFALVWVGILLGLLVPPEAAGVAYVPLFPLTLLANTFVSPAEMPGWLQTIAEWNPLSATVGAGCDLFGNPGRGGEGWAAQHSLALAVGWPLLITLVFLPLCARRYRRLGR